MMNRKDYEELDLEIIRFDAEDVIVTSPNGDGGDEIPPKPGV